MKPVRKRARRACIACNQKRVKCNVTEQVPCRNCASANLCCEIRESRRGKHVRRSRQSASTHAASNTSSTGQGCLDEVAASEVLAGLSRDRSALEDVVALENEASPTEQGSYSDRPEEEGSVFLGESTAIRYVHDDSTPDQPANSTTTPKLLHQIAPAARANRHRRPWEAKRRAAKVKSLQTEGVFTFPESQIVERLLAVYFRWFHCSFAIVDELDIMHNYRSGTISPLLLNALIFISIIHTDDDVLKEMGLGSKDCAKYNFYMRAKDIYDADYEENKLTVIQSVFLISYWRGGPGSEKDVRHWLAVAIALAQSKALHRSTGASEPRIEALKKRLWWSIYVREITCAASLGLPNTIRDEDCDVQPLESHDFDHAFADDLDAAKRDGFTAYQIHMCELAHFLSRIVLRGYLPGRVFTAQQQSEIRQDLNQWKDSLPKNMQLESYIDGLPNLHVSMLHLAYNNLIILLHRPEYMEGKDSGSIALNAAARNSRIVEDMISDGTILRHAQVHVVSLFNTLCIHTIHLRRAEGAAVAIAEHRAKLCLLGLQELQKTWGVQNWLLQLFFQYIDRSTASRLLDPDDAEKVRPRDASVRISLRGSSPRRREEGDSGVMDHDLPTSAGESCVPQTPWSWSTEEQNQFLFSSIEQNFPFGEGAMLDWIVDSMYTPTLPQFQEQLWS